MNSASSIGDIWSIFGLPLVFSGFGAVVCLAAGIWLLVVAFRASIWWGLAVLLLPFAALVFVIVGWGAAKKPFLASVVGVVLMFGGVSVMQSRVKADTPQARAFRAMLAEGKLPFGALGKPTPEVAADGSGQAGLWSATTREEVAAMLADLKKQEAGIQARMAGAAKANDAAKAALAREIADYNQKLAEANRLAAPFRGSPPAGQASASGGAVGSTPAAPALENLWLPDASKAAIPDGRVAGYLSGHPFMLEKASLENGILSLRHGEDFFADAELLIFLFTDGGDQLWDRTIEVAPGAGQSLPHVHMKWKKNGEKMPETKILMRDYTMRIEFGKPDGGKVAGGIYFCAPDGSKSFMAGRFVADVK